MYHELKAQRLAKVGRPGREPSGEEFQGKCDASQLLRSPAQTQSQIKENICSGPRMIKFCIKKSSSFQDNKKKFLFSLLSPGRQAKRSRRRANNNCDGQLSEEKHGYTPDQQYNTAETAGQETEKASVSVRQSQSFQNIPQHTEDEYTIGPEDAHTTRGSSDCLQPHVKHGNHGRGKHKSPNSKSPTKKKRKKKQHQRSIFSKSGQSRKAREPEYPPDEADNQDLSLKNLEIKQQTPSYHKKQTLTNARSKRRVIVPGRLTNNKKFQATNDFQSFDHTECATQELKTLIQQVELEKRTRKSISPHQSKTFVTIDQSQTRICDEESAETKSDVEFVEKSTSPLEKAQVVLPRNCEIPAADLFPSARQESVTTEGEILQNEPSGQYSRLEDNSCCERGVSLSILSRIASMSSQDRSSVRSNIKHPSRKLGEKLNRKTKPRGSMFQTDHHKMFVEAPECYNLKLMSPIGVPFSGFVRSEDLENNKKSTDETSIRTDRIHRPLQVRRMSLGKPHIDALNTKNKGKFDQTAKAETPFILSHEYPARGTRHNVQPVPPNRTRPSPPFYREQVAESRLQDSISTSFSSHYSCLGCIVSSCSTRMQNAPGKPSDLRKNLEKCKPACKKTNIKAQPIEGYILNSKTPIANTLLLCRSGVTTTYENWTTEEAHGPGKVRACLSASSRNKFPSLSSYLEYLERQAATQKNSLYTQDESGKSQLGKRIVSSPLQDRKCRKHLSQHSRSSSQAMYTKTPFEIRQETKDFGLVQESQIQDQKNSQAIVEQCKDSMASGKPVMNRNNQFIGVMGKQPPNRVVESGLEEKNQTLKNPEVKKQSSTVPNKDNKGRSFRPKLRFKYLPLTKQPLPFSAPAKIKKEEKRNSMGQKELKVSSMAVTKMKGALSKEKTDRKQTPQNPQTRSCSKAFNKNTQLQSQMRKDIDESASVNLEKPIHFGVAKPVVVNLRKLCRQPGPILVAKECSKTAQLNSPEKPKKLPSAPAISAEETSLSLDLQSLLEMAKTVLKKKKSQISKTKKVFNSTNQENKEDRIKSDDQTSGSSQCKRSLVAAKDACDVKHITPRDRSYTHLYRTKESRGLKPWGTTKAFTDRLKLMLQENNEHCMNRNAEISPDLKGDKRPRKAYVVHKANLPKTPLCSRNEANSKAAKKSSEFNGRKVLKKKCPKEKDRLKVSNANTSLKNSKAPILRTEALAKKRGKIADNKAQANLKNLTKKKTLKSKGKPLHLTATQLYQENTENRGAELPMHSSTRRLDFRSSDSLRKSSRSMSEVTPRKHPFTGMDPAQVAKLHQETLKDDAFHTSQSSFCTYALSRKNQVQNDLNVLLSKMATRTSVKSPHPNLEILGDDVQMCKSEEAMEGILCRDAFKDGAKAREENPLDVRISSGCSENSAVSCKSRKQTQLRGSRPSDTLLIHTEVDPEPSTAALKFLLQCACNRFHSMPHLPVSRLQSPTATDATRKDLFCEDQSTKIYSDESGVERNDMKHGIQLNVSEIKNKENINDSKFKSCKINVMKTDDTRSKQSFYESISTNNTKVSINSSSDNTKSSLVACTKKRKPSVMSESQTSTVSKSHGNKNLVSRVKKLRERKELRIAEPKQIKSSIKEGTEDSYINNIEPTVMDTQQGNEIRNTNGNLKSVPKQNKTDKSQTAKNGVKGKRSSSCNLKENKNAFYENTTSPLVLGNDYKTENIDWECQGRNSSDHLSNIKLKTENVETARLPSPYSNQIAAHSDQSPVLDMKKASEVPKTHSGFSCSEPQVKIGNGQQFHQQVQQNHHLHQQQNKDISVLSSSLLTSSPLNFIVSSEQETAMLSDSIHDFEPQVPRRSIEIPAATMLERRPTFKSVYGTTDVSSNTASSHKTRPNSHGLNAFIERPRMDVNFECRQSSSEQRFGTISSNVVASQTLRQSGSKKALSHISEESNNSECNQELTPVEGIRNKHMVSHFSCEKNECKTVNKICGSQGSSPTSDCQQRSESLKNWDKDGSKRDQSDKMSTLEATKETFSEAPIQEALRAEVMIQETDFEIDRAAKPLSEQESPGRWFKSPSRRDGHNKPCQASVNHKQDDWESPNSSFGIAIMGVSSLEKHDKVFFDGKSWLHEIPVTVVYTNQNSDIPDLSFTNEDEYSLDSWTQNSICLSKKSLECEQQCNEHNKNRTYHSNNNLTEIPKTALVHECIKRLPILSRTSVRGFCDISETKPGESCGFAGKQLHKVVENDKTNSNDPSGDKKDLESLLDSALDKTFFRRKPSEASLVIPKPLIRKARIRRMGQSVIGSNREVFRSVNKESQIVRDCQDKGISLASCSDVKLNWKVRETPLRGNTEQESVDKAGINSLAMKALDAALPQDNKTAQTDACTAEESDDEQTLQRILKQVSAQPFAITRNRKPRRDEVKTADLNDCKHQTQLTGLSYAETPHKLMDNGICIETKMNCAANSNGSQNQSIMSSVPAEEKLKRYDKQTERSGYKDLDVIQDSHHPSTCRELSDGEHARSSKDLENASLRSAHGTLQQEKTNTSAQETSPLDEVTHDGGDDGALMVKNLEESISRNGNGSKSATKHNDDEDSLSRSRVTVVNDLSEHLTMKPSQQLKDQETKRSAGLADHNGSPCSSSSSSIVLSWVGSQHGSDRNADLISSPAADCPSLILNSENFGDAAGFYFQNSDTKSHFLFENIDLRGKSKEPYRLNSNILPPQSSGFRFNNNSEAISTVGPLQQTNLNENNIKTDMGVYSFHSEVKEDSSTALCYDESGSYDEDDVSGDLINSLYGFYNQDKIRDRDYSVEHIKKENSDGILEQESYLHNLMKNKAWDEEMPRARWDVTATEEKTTVPYVTGPTAPQLLSGRQNPGEKNSRCGYVISAWTNQRQHSDLDQTTHQPGASHQTVFSVKGPVCNRLSPLLYPTMERKNFCCERNNQGMSLQNFYHLKSEEHNRNDVDCVKKPGIGLTSCFSQVFSAGAMGSKYHGARCSKRNTSFPRKSSEMDRHTLNAFSIPRILGLESVGENFKFGNHKAAPSLEEHLRSRFGDPDIRLHPSAARPTSVRAVRHYFSSLDEHLSIRSDGANVCSGDKSPLSPSSLNWYRPQSLSSSNSMNASQAAEAVESRPQEANNRRAQFDFPSKHGMVRDGVGQEINDFIDSQRQAVPSTITANHWGGPQVTRNATTRDQQLAVNSTLRGQQIAANSTLRGQQLAANSKSRGHQLAANSTSRGQQLAANSKSGGQQLAANSKSRGHQLTLHQEDSSK